MTTSNVLPPEIEERPETEERLELRLQSLRDAERNDLADRLNLLMSASEYDDDYDAPLTEAAALGFLDFLADVRFDGKDLSLTSANGWLCSEWEYDDGRYLAVVFKNRYETAVVVLGSDRKLIPRIGRHPSAASRTEATALLVSEGFFAWGGRCST